MKISYMISFDGNEKQLAQMFRLLRAEFMNCRIHEVSEIKEIKSLADGDCGIQHTCEAALSSLLEYHRIFMLPPENADHIRKYLESHFSCFILRVRVTEEVSDWLWVSVGRIGRSPFWRGKVWCETPGFKPDDMKPDLEEVYDTLFAACAKVGLIKDTHRDDS